MMGNKKEKTILKVKELSRQKEQFTEDNLGKCVYMPHYKNYLNQYSTLSYVICRNMSASLSVTLKEAEKRIKQFSNSNGEIKMGLILRVAVKKSANFNFQTLLGFHGYDKLCEKRIAKRAGVVYVMFTDIESLKAAKAILDQHANILHVKCLGFDCDNNKVCL